MSRAFTRSVLVASLTLSAWCPVFAQPPPAAGVDLCGLLSTADTQPLVGPAPRVHRMIGSTEQCNWDKPGTQVSLLLYLDPPSSVPNEMYKYLKGVDEGRKDASVKDEPGLGDSAFSAIYTRGEERK
ncbi:MAG TPA: hypothetical protein VGD54_20355, partial [Steroidobacteraceae bacterium]